MQVSGYFCLAAQLQQTHKDPPERFQLSLGACLGLPFQDLL